MKRPGALRIVGCVLALRDALGLGGGSRPTGVLVQRWVPQQRGVRGAAPGDFFTILMDFEAKSTNHTTYRFTGRARIMVHGAPRAHT